MTTTKLSARQWLVTVSGIDGTWSKISAAETAAEGTRVRDGGATKADVLAGPAETDEVTVTRPFDALRDHDLVTTLLPLVGQFFATITKQPLQGDMTRYDVKPRVYSDCLLTKVVDPESDADSADANMLELTFMVGDVS